MYIDSHTHIYINIYEPCINARSRRRPHLRRPPQARTPLPRSPGPPPVLGLEVFIGNHHICIIYVYIYTYVCISIYTCMCVHMCFTNVDIDMAASENWGLLYKGFRPSFKGFGVDVRQV